MQELRANTQVIVTVGPFVDVGDGFTPQTDITLGGNEAELLKHGSTTVVDISGATWAAVTNCRGYYSLTLTTSHTDTEGLLVAIVQDDSDCLPVKQEYMVLSEAAYDSKYVAKDDGFMDINIKTIGRTDTQETEANNLETICAAYSATRGLAGTALPAIVAGAASGLPLKDASNFLDVANMPAVAAGGAGGLFIAGTNAATSVTTAFTANITGNLSGSVGTLSGLAAASAAKLDDILDGTGGTGLTLNSLVIAASNETGAIVITNGGTNGVGISVAGGSDGAGITIVGSGDSDGVTVAGAGTGHGFSITGGTTGHGLYCFGGSTSGDGIYAAGQTAGDGMTLVAAGASQYDLNADIQGNLSGSVGSVTTKTGYSLASDGLDLQTTWTVDITGTVSGNSTHNAAAVKAAIEAGGSSIAQILADTGELQADDIPGTLATIAGYLDTEIAAIKAVTDVLPDAGALTTIAADTARLTAARAAVLTDWIDGGRLDLLLDALGTAVADKTGYKLANDGLDQISAAEPTTKPTTFAGWVMWLVQRFRRSKLTVDTLTVEKEDGTKVTEQTVSDDETTQQLGAPS